MLFFQLRGNLVRLRPQTLPQDWPVFRILQKRFLRADALHLIARVHRPIVFAKSELLQGRTP
jgi:hypothetical protein